MTRRIPRDLAEECFRFIAKESNRRPVSIEFDVLTWKAGIRLPVFHSETEPVPDPTGPWLILEVLHPTTLTGGFFNFGTAPQACVSPSFVPAVYRPSEIDPDRTISYWSAITFPRDTGIKKDHAARGLATATGRWRIWKSDVLLKAVDLYWENATELGSDRLIANIRDAVDWLEPPSGQKKISKRR